MDSKTNPSREMIIRTREDWEAVLSRGAVVLYETRLCKIFRMPDGELWRVLPRWRRAWPVEVIPRTDVEPDIVLNL